jgi:hypothetical protein
MKRDLNDYTVWTPVSRAARPASMFPENDASGVVGTIYATGATENWRLSI